MQDVSFGSVETIHHTVRRRSAEVSSSRANRVGLDNTLPLLSEALYELECLLQEQTVTATRVFVRSIERLPRQQQVCVREMSPVDVAVYFSQDLCVVEGRLIARHGHLFEELSREYRTQLIMLVEYGQVHHPHRFGRFRV